MKTTYTKQKGRFINPVATGAGPGRGKMFEVLSSYMSGRSARKPRSVLQTNPFSVQEFSALRQGDLGVSWFGHSSTLISIGGKTILTDPVFSERASMFRFAGPKRFDYSHHMSADLLPELDAIIISHDHYDHLDKDTIRKLAGYSFPFYVPLGVGPILQKFGIAPERIHELDWWESVSFQGIDLTCTPSRHFSGRRISNRMGTLWSSWVIRAGQQKLFFSGDSGYFQGFREIGESYGPFDLVLMECGAYSEYWPDIHMQPEQSVQAAVDVGAKTVIPIHWGKFNLSLHPWKESVERFLAAAEGTGMQVITPLPGSVYRVNGDVSTERWWRAYE